MTTIEIIEKCFHTGLFELSEEKFFDWRGCHACNVKAGKMLGNTVHDVVGYVSLESCLAKNSYEFRLCGHCAIELIYGK